MTFKQWLKQVEEEFQKRVGMNMWKFGDFPTRDLYDDGFTVRDATLEIIDMVRDGGWH